MKPRLKLHLDGSVSQIDPPLQLPRDVQKVRESFNRVGKPVTQWARQNGFTPSLVYAVLDGRAKGNRGKSHSIAVLLGLKAGVALAKGAK